MRRFLFSVGRLGDLVVHRTCSHGGEDRTTVPAKDCLDRLPVIMHVARVARFAQVLASSIVPDETDTSLVCSSLLTLLMEGFRIIAYADSTVGGSGASSGDCIEWAEVDAPAVASVLTSWGGIPFDIHHLLTSTSAPAFRRLLPIRHVPASDLTESTNSFVIVPPPSVSPSPLACRPPIFSCLRPPYHSVLRHPYRSCTSTCPCVLVSLAPPSPDGTTILFYSDTLLCSFHPIGPLRYGHQMHVAIDLRSDDSDLAVFDASASFARLADRVVRLSSSTWKAGTKGGAADEEAERVPLLLRVVAARWVPRSYLLCRVEPEVTFDAERLLRAEATEERRILLRAEWRAERRAGRPSVVFGMHVTVVEEDEEDPGGDEGAEPLLLPSPHPLSGILDHVRRRTTSGDTSSSPSWALVEEDIRLAAGVVSGRGQRQQRERGDWKALEGETTAPALHPFVASLLLASLAREVGVDAVLVMDNVSCFPTYWVRLRREGAVVEISLCV